ncbi:hypothetical protein CcaverHIS641_0606820 [Cutaneotrichosporon cavernicola]|nr:hypothetical protein CcaverHIS641_0606820 [Cutaneotrichosporon cavernicola]
MSAIDLNHFPNEEKYGIACTLAGLLLDTFLFGMFSIELITYLNSKAKDPVWVKALVGAVVAMASLSTVPNHGSTCVASLPGLYQHESLPGFLRVPRIQAVRPQLVDPDFCRVVHPDRVCVASLLWAATTMVANMIITVSILYGLMKKRSGIKSTDNLITRFIRMSLESQAATTAIALILLIDTMCVLLFHSKIYVVGLFYVLNSRHQVVVAEEITMNDTHPLAFSRTQAATIVIEQDTEMHVLRVQPPPAPGLNRNPSKSEEGDTKSQSKSEEGDTKSQSSGTAYSASPHPDHKKVAY